MLMPKNWGFSTIEQKEVWSRWKQGESLSDIGRALRKHPGSLHYLIGFYGGICPHEKKRSKKALTLEEREEISRGLASNKSIRQIAFILERSPSTISREINRHGGKHNYRAYEADQRAWQNAARPKSCLLNTNDILKSIVEEKLALKWSPEQISG